MTRRRLFILYYIFIHIFAFLGMVFVFVFLGMQFGLFNVQGSVSERNAFFIQGSSSIPLPKKQVSSCVDLSISCDIFLTNEWQTVSFGLEKDKDIILRVSKETGVPARLIASLAVPEQLRFFSAEREVYKKYFEPLKILGSMSQFSLGVTGIKPETAKSIEDNLKTKTSPYYLGSDYEKILDYKDGQDPNKTQYQRLTNPKDHYYSYLYTALFIKQIQAAWTNAGFPLKEGQEGIYATLFNLGFSKSHPNQNPKRGGAVITVGGKSYTYGDISDIFYTSDTLISIFPK